MASSFSEFFPPPGRGTAGNPVNRFEKLEVKLDPEAMEDLRRSELEETGETDTPDAWRPPSPETVCFKDDSQSIISRNESPDLSFDASLNPYRGCEHGCSYCYARPYHEFLGFSAGLDFETKIMVKPDAPDLLRRELESPNWEPQPLACSGVTDCYQPVERKLRVTRACLEVLADLRNPVTIVTKNRLVARDTDLLQVLAHYRASSVLISLTTLDRDLSSRMEPRASTPAARLRTIRDLAEAGIPVGVSIAPVIPGLNDHEIPSLLESARDHGASFATYAVLRLPYGMPALFLRWLDQHYPGRRELVENRVRELRGGRLNDSTFGQRMKGSGPEARAIRDLFRVSSSRVGMREPKPTLSTRFFRSPAEEQLRLF